MTDLGEIVKIINLAKTSAAQELAISNNLLGVVDRLVNHGPLQSLAPNEVDEIVKALLDSAIKLSEQSKETSSVISKAMGAA